MAKIKVPNRKTNIIFSSFRPEDQNSRRIQIFNTRVNVKRRFYKTHVNNIAAVRTQSKRSKDG